VQLDPEPDAGAPADRLQKSSSFMPESPLVRGNLLFRQTLAQYLQSEEAFMQGA